MSRSEPTYTGEVQSVSGATVSVVLRQDLSSSLLLVNGESYRVGQVGGFMRIPLGYTHLYGVCSKAGAAAAPESAKLDEHDRGRRWVSLTLFGEAIGGRFERGVSQYPTVGDEVHLVTTSDLSVIYASHQSECSITVGNLAASSGIEGRLDLGALVSRHSAVVGSTGSGKSNFVATVLETIGDDYSSARVLIVDPHGEYGSTVGDSGYVFRVRPQGENELPLWVPYWALPFDELCRIAMGGLPTGPEAQVRDQVAAMKRDAAVHLAHPPVPGTVTADSPVPFSIRRLWFELDDYERRTLADKQTGQLAPLTQTGDEQTLVSNIYQPAGMGNSAPFLGPRRGIAKCLELMRSRLQDERYSFLFSPGDELAPDHDGHIGSDLDELVRQWVGHDRTTTVLDVSGLPSEAVTAVVGTVLRIVYDTLFWAEGLPVSGRAQPLLVVLEEAHLFLPEGTETSAHRSVARIAKEGRKYGVGLMVVSQRPTEVESAVLSQCATMISLRLTNAADRSKVASVMPDDLADLAGMLPSLRTGEALVVGEAMPIPSRIRFRQAKQKPVGDNPPLGVGWRLPQRPAAEHYTTAVRNWRSQSTNPVVEEVEQDG